MAELAIYMRDDERGHQTGDIIAVLPDDDPVRVAAGTSQWGRLVGLDDFLIVRVDVPLDEARQYANEALTDSEGGQLGRKRWRMDLEATIVASGMDADQFFRPAAVDWLVQTVAPVWLDRATLPLNYTPMVGPE